MNSLTMGFDLSVPKQLLIPKNMLKMAMSLSPFSNILES